jgi:hypothetical protein
LICKARIWSAKLADAFALIGVRQLQLQEQFQEQQHGNGGGGGNGDCSSSCTSTTFQHDPVVFLGTSLPELALDEICAALSPASQTTAVLCSAPNDSYGMLSIPPKVVSIFCTGG